MKIRKALSSDLPALTEILNQAIRTGGATAILSELKFEDRKGWLRTHQSNPYVLFVAEINGKVIGYLSIGPYRKGRKALESTAEISYFVHYDFHRKGVASKLFGHAIEHCMNHNIKNLVAFLYADNLASVEFMKRNGFELWGLFPKAIVVDEKEIDHAIYGKRLV